MNGKEFAKFLNRDGGCWHCGVDDETLIPHHRLNRGMGGSKVRDVPSNVIVICSAFNTVMESDPVAASLARSYGWKLRAGDDPLLVPVFGPGGWFFLDNKFNKTPKL